MKRLQKACAVLLCAVLLLGIFTPGVFADAVSASFYRSNAKTGNTVSYSVNTYVCAKQADTDTALANLGKALCSYGVSAAAYAD